MGYIYCIENIENGKKYIGLSKDYKDRWRNHIRTIKNGTGSCPILKEAVNKYGINNFKFYIMIICFDEDMGKYEKDYIKKYNTISPNGYNISEGGEASYGFLGKTHSAETRQKITNTLKQRFIDNPELLKESKERVIKMYKEKGTDHISKGQKNSEKWKKALEEKRVGRKNCKHSDEEKKKISEGLKKYYENNSDSKVKLNIEKHRESMAKAVGKKINQYDKDGNFIKTHVSVSEAARVAKINKSTFANYIKNNKEAFADYIWKKAE